MLTTAHIASSLTGIIKTPLMRGVWVARSVLIGIVVVTGALPATAAVATLRVIDADLATGVAVADGRAFVATWSGLRAFDVSDPAAPVALEGANAAPLNTPRGIVVSAGIAFVPQGNPSEVAIIDLETPGGPASIGAIDTFDYTTDVAIAGNLAFVTDRSAGLTIVDVSVPQAPIVLSQLAMPGASWSVTVLGTTAYVGSSNALVVVDVADPGNPVVVGSLPVPGRVLAIAVDGSRAYLAAENGGLRIIDVSIPTAPVETAFLTTPQQAVAVVVRADRAFVGTSMGLVVVDVTNAGAPFVLGLANVGSVGHMATIGHLLYAAAGNRGLLVLDPSNPAAPACSDGLDNDMDGLVDFGTDAGCLTGTATSEYPRAGIALQPGDIIATGSWEGTNAILRIDPASQSRHALDASLPGTGFLDVAVGNDSVVFASTTSGIYRIDVEAGVRTMVSSRSGKLTVDPAGDLVIVASGSRDVLRISVADGSETPLGSVFAEITFPTGVGVELSGDILVSGAGGDCGVGPCGYLVRIDGATGTVSRTLLTVGELEEGAGDIDFDLNGDVLVAMPNNGDCGAVVRVRAADGARTLIADDFAFPCRTLYSPVGIAVEENGSILVTDSNSLRRIAMPTEVVSSAARYWSAPNLLGVYLDVVRRECSDRLDNDGDGGVDLAVVGGDSGCNLLQTATESPQCDDDLDNDLDGFADHPLDDLCQGPWDDDESADPQAPACGLLGVETLPALAYFAMRRTRKRRDATRRCPASD